MECICMKMRDRYLFKAKRVDNGEWEIGSLIALPTGEYEISNKCNNPPDCDPMWDKNGQYRGCWQCF